MTKRIVTAIVALALFVPVSFPIAVFALRKKQPVDYADYIRKKREAYYRRYGGGYVNSRT